jgi:hypothetical protein
VCCDFLNYFYTDQSFFIGKSAKGLVINFRTPIDWFRCCVCFLQRDKIISRAAERYNSHFTLESGIVQMQRILQTATLVQILRRALRAARNIVFQFFFYSAGCLCATPTQYRATAVAFLGLIVVTFQGYKLYRERECFCK